MSPLKDSELWAIYAHVTGITEEDAKQKHSNRKRGWLLSEICHHICDGTYAQEQGSNSNPLGGMGMSHKPKKPNE